MAFKGLSLNAKMVMRICPDWYGKDAKSKWIAQRNWLTQRNWRKPAVYVTSVASHQIHNNRSQNNGHDYVLIFNLDIENAFL